MLRILSIDGGGVRGVIPAVVLAEIERITGQPACRLFDLITGTSIGGIMALALARPKAAGEPMYAAKDLLRFFHESVPKIFGAQNWTGPRYGDAPLEAVLLEFFGDSMLADATTELLVTGYCTERRRTVFFKSGKAKTNPRRNVLMRSIARATSAAPTYFMPFKMPVDPPSPYYSLIDAGLFVNNPALCGLTEIWKKDPSADALVVSLGTGDVSQPYHHADMVGWWLKDWPMPAISMAMSGSSEIVDYQLRTIMRPALKGEKRYYRFQRRLDPKGGEFDDASEKNLQRLMIEAGDLVRDSRVELSTLCDLLQRTHG
jgi:patatin-like phospholipase/acyl hydrolase